MQAKAKMAALLMKYPVTQIPSHSLLHHPEDLALCLHKPRWRQLDEQVDEGMAKKVIHCLCFQLIGQNIDT